MQKKKKKQSAMQSSSPGAVQLNGGDATVQLDDVGITVKPDGEDSRIAKHRAKDSVFTDLFRDKRYLFQLYPEGKR